MLFTASEQTSTSSEELDNARLPEDLKDVAKTLKWIGSGGIEP